MPFLPLYCGAVIGFSPEGKFEHIGLHDIPAEVFSALPGKISSGPVSTRWKDFGKYITFFEVRKEKAQ